MSRDNEFPRTWLWLLGKLQGLTAEQLAQPVQVFGPDICDGKVHLLKPAVSLGTVEELLHADGQIGYETRGPDFAHHPEQVILSIDHAPFDEDGDEFFTMTDARTGKAVGNKTGKVVDIFGGKAGD
jgi:hypothetical protein